MLNLILSRGWTDYDNFSSKLSYCIAKEKPHTEKEVIWIIESVQTPFFKFNSLKKSDFLSIFPIKEILYLFQKHAENSSITFTDIFPETNKVSIDDGKKRLIALEKLPESVIQETMVDSLRERNATNCRSRGKDTVLEVADLEHFSFEVQGSRRTFTAVVKGHKSLSGTITLEKIAHQILKAYNRTYPDYVLLVLARNLADGVISEFVQYGKSVGNENLIVMADPLTLVRFLKARRAI